MLLITFFGKKRWSDKQIVEGILGDSRSRNASLTALYEQNRTFLIKFLQNKGHQQGFVREPEDIIWEAMTALLNNILDGKYQVNSSVPLSGYLTAICRNLWHKYLDQEQNRQERQFNFIEESQQTEPDITQILSNQQKWERYLEIFEKAGKNCKQIFTLWLVNGMDNKEIAEIMMQEGKLKNEQVVRNAKSDCLKKVTEMLK
ncbi:MAG: sigma-70 family RNA polymerase sigma factor [Spirosomaceae bacterium]|jgi:RNA polymerase sigma factor (sigma-70 family)|nr:sigma-70 family RNA polymerase sigma factor [Spirosomataceae bacterium]